jgi:hypothetical protein
VFLTATWAGAEGGARIEGRVLDKATRAPVKDALVSLYLLGSQLVGAMGSWGAATDDSGRFTFTSEDEIEGTVLVICRKSGYVSFPPDQYLGPRFRRTGSCSARRRASSPRSCFSPRTSKPATWDSLRTVRSPWRP